MIGMILRIALGIVLGAFSLFLIRLIFNNLRHMEDSDKPKETSDKPNNEALVLKQLKSIKVALWTLVTVFVILPVVGAIGTGVVIGFMALTAEPPPPPSVQSEKEEWGHHNNTPSDPIPRDWGVRPTEDGEAANVDDSPPRRTLGTDE